MNFVAFTRIVSYLLATTDRDRADEPVVEEVGAASGRVAVHQSQPLVGGDRDLALAADADRVALSVHRDVAVDRVDAADRQADLGLVTARRGVDARTERDHVDAVEDRDDVRAWRARVLPRVAPRRREGRGQVVARVHRAAADELPLVDRAASRV